MQGTIDQNSLYNLFEKSPLPMWVFDTQTLFFLEVNLAAELKYGYSKREFLALKITDIRPSEDVAYVNNIVKENKKNGKYYSNVFRHIKKNGEMIFVEIESNLIDFNGIQARLVLAQDMTSRITAEQQLALSEQRFKALVQEGSDLIAIVDLELNYKYVSPTSLRVLGIESNAFIGKSALSFIHPDDVEQVVKDAEKLKTNYQVQFSPFRFKNIKEEWRWIETRATNLSEDSSILGIVCNSRDITERVEHEKQIFESVERYKIVARATRDVIWDYNLKTKKISWNLGISGVLKYKSSELLTDAFWWENNIHPEDRPRVLEKIGSYIDQGIEFWKDEYRFLCGDGVYRYIMDRGYIGFDTNQNPYRMIGAMQDITDSKKQMSAIEEQNNRLKEIAWLQSHAVRAPLTKIMALVNLLKYNCIDERSEELIKYLSQSSVELDQVITSITNKTHKTSVGNEN